MKKTLLVLLAVVLFAIPTMAQVAADANGAKAVQFAQVTPFNMTTRTGEIINMQNLLSQGKTIIIDLSCCWCAPCWSLHQSGVLEYLHEQYGAPGTDEFFIIWAEIEGTNTDAQITGTSTSSGRDGLTQGDWTNGGTVPYAIVDNAQIPRNFSLYAGSVPTVFMIFPNGYYRDITSEIRSGSATQSAATVYALRNYYPRAGETPMVEIAGPTAIPTNAVASFTADILSVDPVTSISWSFDGGNPATATGASATTTWATSGTHNVSVAVTNANGTTTESTTVNVIQCDAITDLPIMMDFSDGLGCWTTYAADPANNEDFGILSLTDGSKCFLFSSYNQASNYNQYLISPELNLSNSFALSFYYLSNNGYPETFKVLYSTTDNNISSFTNVVADITSTNEDHWEMFSGVIPANAKYIAIDYYSEYLYYLLVSDIALEELTTPTVSLNAPASAFVNSTVSITAVATMAETYSWSIDGTPIDATGSSISEAFTTPGNHTVSVTVSNRIGSANASATINVKNFGDTLYYDNGEFATNIGTGGAIYWGIRFDPDMLTGRNTLTDVLFYVADAGSYQLTVYEGGTNAPRTQLATQTERATSSQCDTWKTIHLNTPVTFDATQPLWITFHTTGISYPAAGSDFTGNYNGSMVSLDGSEWMTIQEASSSLSATWMIRAVIPNGIGINTVDNSAVALYPNPVNDKLTVVAEGVQKIEVIDATGRTVVNVNKAGVIDMSNLSSGIYMVRTITNEGVNTQKIVKK